LGEGLGHAFVALADYATVSYFVSDNYNPAAEHGINPLDSEIWLAFPQQKGKLLLSPKDIEAPSLSEVRDAGLLRTWVDVRKHYELLDSKTGRQLCAASSWPADLVHDFGRPFAASPNSSFRSATGK
jgi:dTDP-4-dehydrorhamnose 3,5-epimerase